MSIAVGQSIKEPWWKMNNPAEYNDMTLTRAVASGDSAAFNELYNRFSARFYSLARRLSGDASLSEDMTQEVFLHIIRKAHLVNGKAGLSTWVHRIAVNYFISFLRRYRPLKYPQETGDAIQAYERKLSTQSNPTIYGRMDLESSLAKLPDGYRRVLVLHDVEGYKHKEIAEKLGISPGTSKSQLHHARMKLRSLLKGETQ